MYSLFIQISGGPGQHKRTIRKKVEERKNMGFGIVNEIIAILDEIPLGGFKLEIGLKLRQAMLLNNNLFSGK